MTRLILFLLSFLFLVNNTSAQFDARWVEVPNSSHITRELPGVVYDPSGDRIIMFSGGMWFNRTGANSTFFCTRQFQEFTSVGWSEIPFGGATTKIRPRTWVNYCYDSSSNRIVFGGGGDVPNSYTDTWALQGNTLTQINTNLDGANEGKGFFFNSVRNSVCFLRGDGQIHELQNDSWVSLAFSTPTWGISPHELFGFSFSYNPNSGKLVVFGGETGFPDPPLSLISETHIFNANTNTWTEPQPALSPEARFYGNMVFHPVRGTHILFAGTTYANKLDDIWEFDDTTNTWSELLIENPRTVSHHRLIYNPTDQKVLSIGGYEVPEQTNQVSRIYELQFIAPAGVNGKDWQSY